MSTNLFVFLKAKPIVYCGAPAVHLGLHTIVAVEEQVGAGQLELLLLGGAHLWFGEDKKKFFRFASLTILGTIIRPFKPYLM